MSKAWLRLKEAVPQEMFSMMDSEQKLPAMRTDQFLPEKGVMFDADFPQPLGSSVVRKLKTNCAFKLLILEEREEIEMHRI